MDRTTFLDDERAVPPVIGVILMAAIVVVLAALVTSYVFGLGIFGFETVPQASFEFEYDDTVTNSTFNSDGCFAGGSFDSSNVELEIKHVGGESIPADQLFIIGAAPSEKKFHECSSLGPNDEVKNEDAAYIEAATDDTVRIVWESEAEDNTQTLKKWDGSKETE